MFLTVLVALAGVLAALLATSGGWVAKIKTQSNSAQLAAANQFLVDTSVLIDGRIIDIAKAGFMRSTLLVPRFVLSELQTVADSEDSLKRARGRRGLEMLSNLQSTPELTVEIIGDDPTQIHEVDAKLVSLARSLGTDILTTDYNLNQVAQIEGVKVLNINELTNAIRPVVLPGETLSVKVVQQGKESNQGVGYLPDGTMIVVEHGDKLINQEVLTEVTRVFQTVAGKMIFATPLNNGSAQNKSNHKPHRQTSNHHNRNRQTDSQKPSA